MNIALWVVQTTLALLFLVTGWQKMIMPVDRLLKNGMTWANRFPNILVRLIGIVEIWAAVGLILPWAFQILPILTPLAASGLILVMLLAIIHHTRYQEGKAAGFNAALLLLSTIVAYSRFTMLA